MEHKGNKLFIYFVEEFHAILVRKKIRFVSFNIIASQATLNMSLRYNLCQIYNLSIIIVSLQWLSVWTCLDINILVCKIYDNISFIKKGILKI